jgi:hypothetical protein
MKQICTARRLQNTNLYKEHQQLMTDCYKLSLEKEQNQLIFFKRHSFVKSTSGEFIKPTYSFENDYKKQSKAIEKRSSAIENLSQKKGT